ncbi:hypothetical protein [Methylomusa anaerophila]|uniref:Uncharacterized protein n=1 Tax=Methylomusa anaerophila TaxID=1930071 RepID=A0A348AEQ8_9FIRM|nr:hypothetical protein [Methylomusa anaerophila]BBB89556.1 hypothetical protein MAMMFC1_00189 [Methylomusa anaerophila]
MISVLAIGVWAKLAGNRSFIVIGMGMRFILLKRTNGFTGVLWREG